jgi:hypothetical protein
VPKSGTTEAAIFDTGQMFGEGQKNLKNYTAEYTRRSSEKKNTLNRGSTHVSVGLGKTYIAGEKCSQ